MTRAFATRLGQIEQLFCRLAMKAYFRGDLTGMSLPSFTISNTRAFLRAFRTRPLISILVPVYNTDLITLKKCIDSVLRQVYRKWELCIVDDASTDPQVRQVLLDFALKDHRIKLVFSKENGGIAETINQAARLAGGQFIGVLDHDDELDPETLFEYVRCINSNPDADVIYCDEDKIDENGKHSDPWYKSDWNPDLLYSFNYVMHFVLLRRRVFEQAGGVRTAYEGSQDYDLLLRVSQQTDKIYHVPRILYHWRMGKVSIASGPEAKPGVFVSGLAALQDALDRRGIDGTATDAPDAWKGVYRVRRRVNRNLSCAIIVSFMGDREGLIRLLDSVRKNVHHGVGEIIICAQGPIGDLKWNGRKKKDMPIRWVDTSGSNLPTMFNLGADCATSDLLLFMNEKIEIRTVQSIDALVEQAQRESVGAAGGKIYYENGLVEHGGIIFGPFNLLGYAHRATPDGPGYAGLKNMIGNFSAVMGLGMMTRKRLFNEIGGFDASFESAYWDADYCLRLNARGYRITYTPYATFTHHIRVPTIEQMIIEPDASIFRERWQCVIDRDPYFNPNFLRTLECFAVPEWHVQECP